MEALPPFDLHGAHQRIDDASKRIQRLIRIGDGATHVELPDHEHAQMLEALRSIFQLARRGTGVGGLSGQLIQGATRARLLSSGLELNRMACSSRALRDELTRSATLLFFTLACDIRVSSERAAQAAERTHQWLDAPWRDELAEVGVPTDADMGQRFLFGARRRGITEAALRIEALGYFACAGAQLQLLVLGSTRAAIEVEERPLKRVIADPVACSLVEAADADLGQQVFRDIALSFLMPRRSVGWRRMLLFDRATAKVAERQHHQILNRAHNAAMQTPSHVWANGVIGAVRETEQVGDFLTADARDRDRASRQEAARTAAVDDDEEGEISRLDPDSLVERTSAILAGVAMNVAGAVDEARKGDAFGGRVELPFLRTTVGRAVGDARMVLLGGEWFYYTGMRDGSVRVHIRGRGLSGLVACAAALTDDIRARGRAAPHE